MQADYVLELAGKAVGTVTVQRQGLYYCIRCRCGLPGNEMYRLTALSGDTRINLGTVIPMEDGFGADTRFPASRVREETLSFQLVQKNGADSCFVRIDPKEPFPYLPLLKYAVLEEREGGAGACIPAEKMINRRGAP